MLSVKKLTSKMGTSPFQHDNFRIQDVEDKTYWVHTQVQLLKKAFKQCFRFPIIDIFAINRIPDKIKRYQNKSQLMKFPQ